MAGLKEKLARWFLPAFMLASSITMLAVGVPRFLHELMLVPGTPILNKINSGIATEDPDLLTLERSRKKALDFAEAPTPYFELGSLYLTRARQAETETDRRRYALLAIETSYNGLYLAPRNTYGWLRIALAKAMLGQNEYQEGLQAWRNSIRVSPFEPSILMTRVHLGILFYQDMTEDDVASLKSQLKDAYSWRRWDIILYARQHNIIDWVIFLAEPGSEMEQYLVTNSK